MQKWHRARVALGTGLLVIGACLPVTPGAALAQGDALSWTTITEGPKFDEGNTLYAVTTLPGGEAVIVGARGCCGKAWSWHSSDGLTWEFVEMPGVKDGQATDIANFGEGVIAVGGRQRKNPSGSASDGMVWTTEDPTAWSAPSVIPKADLRSVSVSEDGLVIAGAAVSKSGRKWIPAVWHSSDGESWERTLLGKAGQFLVRMELARAPSGAWIAAAETLPPDDGPRRTEMWRSEDGTSWEAIPFPGIADDRSGFSLQALPEAVLALVNYWAEDGTTRSSVLRTVDGVEWTEVAQSDHHWFTTAADGPTGALLFTTVALLVAVGANVPAEAEPLLLSSTDGGLTWTEFGTGEPVPDFASSATIDAEGQVIVVGANPVGDPLSWPPKTWLGTVEG